MYCLTSHETHQVSGAVFTVTINDCLKISEWQQLHKEAQREGIMLGTIAAIITEGALYGVTTGLFAASTTTAIGIGAPVAALAFFYGYSSGYNNYELWPWN